MKMRALVMCAVLSGGVCGVMRAADWPAFGGPTHDGVAAEVGINKDWTARPPKTLWTVNLGDDGHAGMSVAEGKVFIVDHAEGKDVVRALDVATGREVWSFGYVDAKKNRYGYSVATPLVENGRVYTISRLNKVHCLNAATGEMYWSRDLLKDFAGARTEWDYAASPVMVEGKLIVFPGGKNAAVAALDVTNGQTLWQGAGDSRPGYATPVIAKLNGRTQIVAFLAEGMLGIDPATGERLWTFPWVVDHQQNSATPLVRGNTIFYSTAWGKGSGMLDVSDNQPKVLWQSKQMQARFPTPVISHERIYGTQDPGKLVCLDAKTGNLLWQQTGFEFASTIAVDDCIVVQEGKSGTLILLDALSQAYKELGRITPLGGPECWVAPIVADGKLLVRNKKMLACLDLK